MAQNGASVCTKAGTLGSNSVGNRMAAATFLLALVAAIAAFVISYVAAGFGVFVSLGFGYLTGSLVAIVIVLVSLRASSSRKTGILRRGEKRVSSPSKKQPRS